MKRKDILFISISGFILVLAWIGFSIFHNVKTSTISETTTIQIAPIQPNFDINEITEIKNRQDISPVFQQTTPSPTPIATTSATTTEPQPTPSPTKSEKKATVSTTPNP